MASILPLLIHWLAFAITMLGGALLIGKLSTKDHDLSWFVVLTVVALLFSADWNEYG